MRSRRRRRCSSGALLLGLLLAGCKPAGTLDLGILQSPLMNDDPFANGPGTLQLRVQPSLGADLDPDTDVTLLSNLSVASAPYRANARLPLAVPDDIGDRAALALAYFSDTKMLQSLGRSLQFGKSDQRATVYVGLVNQLSAAPSQPMRSRWGMTATLLPNGKVLLAGGATGGTDQMPKATDALELYDPATGSFTLVDPSGFGARIYHTAVLDASGKVVFMGGLDENGQPRHDVVAFDPATNTVAPLDPPLPSDVYGHVAALLTTSSDANAILVAGGYVNGAPTADAFIYRPGSTPRMVAMPSAHAFAAATSLQNNTGEILVTGGYDDTNQPTAAATIYDPSTAKFVTPTAAPGSSVTRTQMKTPRVGHVAVSIGLNQVVLIYGGNDGTKTVAAPEVFVPNAGATGAFVDVQASGAATATPAEHLSAVAVGGSSVLLIGGENNGGALSQLLRVQALDMPSASPTGPFGVSITVPSVMATAQPARARAAVVRLVDGSVLYVGGGIGQPRVPTDATTATAAQIFVPCWEQCVANVTP